MLPGEWPSGSPARRRGARVILPGRHGFRMGQAPEAAAIHEGRAGDVLAAIRDAAGPNGLDAAILAVGSADAVDVCLRSLRPRGRLVLFSAVTPPPPVDLFRVHARELEILGACNDEYLVDEALTLPGEGAAEGLITHRISFAEWPRAFELAAQGKDEALKVAVTF